MKEQEKHEAMEWVERIAEKIMAMDEADLAQFEKEVDRAFFAK